MKILKYSLVMTISLTLTGCMAMQKSGDGHSGMGIMSMMPMMGMMNMGSANNSSKLKTTKEGEHSKPYIIANRYCTQCHGMKDKNLHSANEWKPTLRRMIGYMQNQGKLQPDEYEKVMIEHHYGVEG
ncbi:MAG: hypothetical protein L3J19_01940 [Sulfurimonas sp.]|nr:hypothetical protein [Sulfurimonas sp.]